MGFLLNSKKCPRQDTSTSEMCTVLKPGMEGWMVAAILLGLLCHGTRGFSSTNPKDISRAAHDARHALSAAAHRALRSLKKADMGVKTSLPDQKVFGRHILQDGQAVCAWEDEQCLLSDAQLFMDLKDSDSDLVQVLLPAIECGAHYTMNDCEAHDCLWTPYGDCDSSINILDTIGNAQCFGHLGVLAQFGLGANACLDKFSAPAECNAEDGCAWDDDDAECGPDIWLTLMGVPTVNGSPEGLEKASEAQQALLISALLSNLTLITSTNPEDYLSWVPPELECPTDVDQRVCDFVEPSSDLVKVQFYCRTKYENGGSLCDEDPQCKTEGSECTFGNDVQRDTLSEQFESQETCVDACGWDWEESECSLNTAFLYEAMAGEAEKSSRPICKAVSAYFKSGCLDAEEEACTENPSCQWDGFQEDCEVNDRSSALLLLNADPELAHIAAALQNCVEQTNEEDCLTP